MDDYKRALAGAGSRYTFDTKIEIKEAWRAFGRARFKRQLQHVSTEPDVHPAEIRCLESVIRKREQGLCSECNEETRVCQCTPILD